MTPSHALSDAQKPAAYLIHVSPMLAATLPLGTLFAPLILAWWWRSSPVLAEQAREVFNLQLTYWVVTSVLGVALSLLILMGLFGELLALVVVITDPFGLLGGSHEGIFNILMSIVISTLLNMAALSIWPLVEMVLGLLAAARGEVYRPRLCWRFWRTRG